MKNDPGTETPVLETERLVLHRFVPGDAPFIVELLNDPDFLRFIGDRGVQSLEQAKSYIRDGPAASYAAHGFGLYRVTLKIGLVPIGMCGLLKRAVLPDVDIGYAFLPAYRRRGYAFEAAAAVLAYGKSTLGLRRIVAITAPDNEASGRLLEKLGMRCERTVDIAECGGKSKLYA